ncbi:MAG: tRNA pseudouridine(55) synthase TruB [Weeksellaceae bacterium]|nr:tRNA pseudouridine(55) synthase TruB [Weeksellaceae bacterium]
MISLDEFQQGRVLLIDKPLDWTSFDVVKKIRWNICRAFDIKKIKVGHAGTLDPKATGLLIVCTGKFTKKINEIQAQTKVYTGTMKLGATTPTFDTESEENQIFPIEHITEEQLNQATQKFLGEIQQHPPIHSAVKKDGKRLYELARAGEVVETEARTVRIDEFKITKIEMPFVDFEVQCGKGTYIRSLANDFGEALNSGA